MREGKQSKKDLRPDSEKIRKMLTYRKATARSWCGRHRIAEGCLLNIRAIARTPCGSFLLGLGALESVRLSYDNWLPLHGSHAEGGYELLTGAVGSHHSSNVN